MRKRKPFEPLREDGRSNADVILAVFDGRQPGDLVTYAELLDALRDDCDVAYTVKDVHSMMSRVYPRLLEEQQKAPANVPRAGYRIALAAEHTSLADKRKSFADRQMLRGIKTLEGIRREELTENERRLADGQLMIMSALYHQMKAMERRQDRIEATIRKIVGRKD